MDITTLLLVLSPLIVITLVLQIAAIVSIARKPVPGNDKLIWLLLSLLANPIGPIIYFAIGSNKLDERVAEIEDNKEMEN
ncbi:MAG: PLDc N-terminal domain-containing protein [Defluviitaleaceae bacterium]|nr:PLDc N-terminal domain-containing protein [Defluviitaleaceae bacterium]